MKDFLSKFLHPTSKRIALIDVIAVALLVVAFACLTSIHPISLIAYLFSTYALVVSALNFKRVIRAVKVLICEDKIPIIVSFKRLMHKNKYTAQYLDSPDFRAEISLYSGLAANLIFALFKSFSGAYYHSSWLISVGVYYLAYGSIRFMLMWNFRKHRNDTRTKEVTLHEYKTARTCGMMMLLLNITVAGMAYHMIDKNETSHYSRLVAIVSATYTFYYVITAIKSTVKFRKRENAIFAATKKLNISGAALSLFTLQTAMIHTFDGTFTEQVKYANWLTGTIVFFVMLWNALSMGISANRKMKQIEQEDET